MTGRRFCLAWPSRIRSARRRPCDTRDRVAPSDQIARMQFVPSAGKIPGHAIIACRLPIWRNIINKRALFDKAMLPDVKRLEGYYADHSLVAWSAAGGGGPVDADARHLKRNTAGSLAGGEPTQRQRIGVNVTRNGERHVRSSIHGPVERSPAASPARSRRASASRYPRRWRPWRHVGLDCRYCRGNRGDDAGVRLQQADFDHRRHSVLFELSDHQRRCAASPCEGQSADRDCKPGAREPGAPDAIAGGHSALASYSGVQIFAAGLQHAGGRFAPSRASVPVAGLHIYLRGTSVGTETTNSVPGSSRCTAISAFNCCAKARTIRIPRPAAA